ncbi:hypothetical protein M3Y98_00401300 [Aphelenchoides besseyi]|nr:hypothetical protein M3Y98_00401300 [Aphelenchoides besseyi]KAI6202258.1 hypothetical protein M3Y96_00929200 [Aphelenchoides besseyi]
MSLRVFVLFTILFVSSAKEVLPEDCHCRDWYGGCKQNAEQWTDDYIWHYKCLSQSGEPATFNGCVIPETNRILPSGSNQTIDGFWYTCDQNNIRLKYEQEPKCVVNNEYHHIGDYFRDGNFHWLCLETGRWVKGCYYQNETKDWVLLNLGQVGYNGLIRHTCDLYRDNPGVVQYHAEVREDVAHKHPPNKGINQNFPNFADNRLKSEPVLWLHTNAAHFIPSNGTVNLQIRYLPASRNVLPLFIK